MPSLRYQPCIMGASRGRSELSYGFMYTPEAPHQVRLPCLCSMAARWCKGRRGSPRGAPRTTKVQYATDRVGRMPMCGILLPTGVVKSTLSAELASQPSLSPPNLYKGEGSRGSLLGVQHLEREMIPCPHLDKQRTLDL